MTMTDAAMKSQVRRTLADSFMRDAQREATPWRSRTDLAFEAVYLYALQRPKSVDRQPRMTMAYGSAVIMFRWTTVMAISLIYRQSIIFEFNVGRHLVK
jgi:hypothetical protein